MCFAAWILLSVFLNWKCVLGASLATRGEGRWEAAAVCHGAGQLLGHGAARVRASGLWSGNVAACSLNFWGCLGIHTGTRGQAVTTEKAFILRELQRKQQVTLHCASCAPGEKLPHLSFCFYLLQLSDGTINIFGCSYKIKYEIDKSFACMFLNYFGYSVTVQGQNTQFSLKVRYLYTQTSVINWVGLIWIRLDISAFKWGSKYKWSMVVHWNLCLLGIFFTVQEFWFWKRKNNASGIYFDANYQLLVWASCSFHGISLAGYLNESLLCFWWSLSAGNGCIFLALAGRPVSLLSLVY